MKFPSKTETRKLWNRVCMEEPEHLGEAFAEALQLKLMQLNDEAGSKAVTRPKKPCRLFHSWQSDMTCATYRATGPLPGELHVCDGLGQPGYRYERYCTDCDRRDYHAYGRWWEIPLPKAKP